MMRASETVMRNETGRFAIALMAALCLHATVSGEAIQTRELVLCNNLDRPRTGELVVVSLGDLGVPDAEAQRIRSAEARDAAGKRVLCQFDSFAQTPPFTSEVALLVDLKPYERRMVTIRFLSGAPDTTDGRPVSLTRKGTQVDIETRTFKARVVQRPDGLWFYDVTSKTRSTGEKLRADMLEAEDDLGDAPDRLTPGTAPSLKVMGALAESGQLFAFQGFTPFGRAPGLRAWSGPVRAVVTLFDDAPWRVAKMTVPAHSRQTLSIPARGNVCVLTCEVIPTQEVPGGRFRFGGLRVDSWNRPWGMALGQKARPPAFPECPEYPLDGKSDILIDPEVIRPSLTHDAARLFCKPYWVILTVDRRNTTFPRTMDWGTGRGMLNSHLIVSDGGPHKNALETFVRAGAFPPGRPAIVRAAVWFGSGSKPTRDQMEDLSTKFNARIAVPHRPATPTARTLDAARLRELVRTRDVVVVTPDHGTPDEQALWRRVAEHLGGSLRTSAAFLRFVNVVKAGPPLLIVAVGEPGRSAVLDEINESHAGFCPYPLRPDRYALALLGGTRDEDAVLLVSGSTPQATAAAVDALVTRVGPRTAVPALSISARSWADRMPFPWLGCRDHDAPVRTLAFRNARADFLLMLRANRAIDKLSVGVPPGMTVRSVRWYYGTSAKHDESIVPKNDAAFAAVPRSLGAGAQLGLWLSSKVPADAPVGTQTRKAVIHFDGQTREVVLETRVLAPVLAERYPVGFKALGAEKDMFKLYFDWKDDATYYRHLPRVLRQMAAFGVDSYHLAIDGLQVSVDEAGNISVDATGLANELAAVRQAGVIRTLHIGSPHSLRPERISAMVAKRRGLDDPDDAWDQVVAPALRKALRELGLEDRLYCRHGDEIGDYEAWLYPARKFKRAGLKLTVAINYYGVLKRELAVGTMDMWIPQYPFYVDRLGRKVADDDPTIFNRNFRDARLAAGEPIWPYVCGLGPYMWSARPRAQGRFLIEDVYMKKAQGLVYYGGTVWSHAFLSTRARRTQKADLLGSDCTFVALFYPDAASNSIVPSLRLGCFRQGLEDAAAIACVRRLAREKGRGEEVEKRIAAAYATLNADATQAAFDTFRLALDKICGDLAR